MARHRIHCGRAYVIDDDATSGDPFCLTEPLCWLGQGPPPSPARRRAARRGSGRRPLGRVPPAARAGWCPAASGREASGVRPFGDVRADRAEPLPQLLPRHAAPRVGALAIELDTFGLEAPAALFRSLAIAVVPV